MTGFDFFIVLIGILLVVASFLFGEKISGDDKEENFKSSNSQLDEEKILSLQRMIETNMKGLSESAIQETEKQLNTITNEKIMAISDFANELLEKINQNQTEVVFLYNMLNEKEESLKKFMLNKDTVITENQSNNDTVLETKGKERDEQKEKSTIEGINEEEAALLSSFSISSDESTLSLGNDTVRRGNRNEEILQLHSQGMTITQIAKKLHLGKGEVSFVVNLNQ